MPSTPPAACSETTKKKIARKAGGMRWELLRELVWLASGGTREPDERTVRRYLEKQRPAKDSAEAYWQSKLDLMGHAFRLAKQWRAQPEIVDKLGPPRTMSETGQPMLDNEPFASMARSYL